MHGPHQHDRGAIDELTTAISTWIAARLTQGPSPLHAPPGPEELAKRLGPTITDDGLGTDEALRLFTDIIAPSCLVTDHPRFFAFVPSAPSAAASLLDATLGASAIFGGSWLEGSGAVHAENTALGWLAELAGLPGRTRGAFVSGGSAGNLSALLVARSRWREQERVAAENGVRPLLVCSDEAHSSVARTAEILDVDRVTVAGDRRGRLDGAALRRWQEGLDRSTRSRIFAVVATAGTTNAGVVDDLAAAAQLATACDAWFHVDGAYGVPAMLDERTRALFGGIELADSLIVDPHKWLFAPFDVCALLYRDPDLARRVHTQHAEYLDPLLDDVSFNPSDLAYHLSRRSRGLPLWFSLAVNGTDAYRRAIAMTLDLAADTADVIDAAPHLELVLEPELSVVLFRRTGWRADDYEAWSDRALEDGRAFLLPTEWRGETVFRCCFTNPATTIDDVRPVLDSMTCPAPR